MKLVSVVVLSILVAACGARDSSGPDTDGEDATFSVKIDGAD
ncbi:MAG: hypothetical protein AB7T31_16645 [Gemmatimonadales bacterium]